MSATKVTPTPTKIEKKCRKRRRNLLLVSSNEKSWPTFGNKLVEIIREINFCIMSATKITPSPNNNTKKTIYNTMKIIGNLKTHLGIPCKCKRTSLCGQFKC
uniref:Uncharacterized protein n=1 Tax=Cacopsylla melanoneura TaxID=428564 RepID=A0A8D8R7B7_9HEMI